MADGVGKHSKEVGFVGTSSQIAAINALNHTALLEQYGQLEKERTELAEALRAAKEHMVGLKCYLATCSTDVIVDNLETTIAGLRREIEQAEKLLAELA